MNEYIHQKIDIDKDREYILDIHCRVNYECDTPWKRKMPYEEYQKEWFSLHGQVSGFLLAYCESLHDERTIAEILADQDGNKVGYIWAPFVEDSESGFCFADIREIYIEDAYRKKGVASYLLQYAEKLAKENGAQVIRSGTGCENIKSIDLHKKNGYYTYRYEFEKVL